MAAPKFPNLFGVNLLVRLGEQEKIYTKLIKWALSSGRYIVIFVEVITISAFVYRYKLDADLADIQEQINGMVPYIQGLSANETLIKNTQFQINNITKLKTEKADFISPLKTLTTIIPRSISLNSITFDRNLSYPRTSVSITGESPSNIELSIFIKELQKSPVFSDINLTNISFDQQTDFTITGNLTGKTGAN